ncbi:predicted protein [Nematostella vectensis]|uniref:Uncharacterized protein n=1 Tax=Nematostella vectensis TaxID=45351 RepID=A7SA84_NEMVE|nr:predicted protein [Nematostella vectensis]|eukprot:XP_001631478.1 predicted protein [Nematostella vectensis]
MKEEAVDEMAADKDESEIKALWVTFVGTSTFHGLHYLFDALSRLRKLAWALLLLAAFTVFVRQILYGYTKLQKHEVFITTEFKPNVELTFPAVTVCNVNMMKKSHLLKTEAQTYLDGTDWRHPNMRQLYKAYNKSYNLEKAVQDYGHVYSDMIKKCQFIGQACDKVFEIRTFIDAKVTY